jgi:hypothetical protein
LKINGYWSINEPFQFATDNKTAEVEIDLQLSMQKKLSRVIDKEMNVKIISKSRTTKVGTSVVKKELAIFEVESNLGTNFESCYENLNSIPSRSVEPECVFSRCARIVTKIRSSLHDESVDMLTFLREYFETENNRLLIKKDCQFKILHSKKWRVDSTRKNRHGCVSKKFDTQTCENDTFACEIHTPACRF